MTPNGSKKREEMKRLNHHGGGDHGSVSDRKNPPADNFLASHNVEVEMNEDHSSVNSFDSNTSSSEGSRTSQVSRTSTLLRVGAKETSQVCWLRGFLLIVLLLATFLMAIAIFYSTRSSELDQFELQYADHAAKIFDTFQANLKDMVVASDNLAASLTAHGKSTAAASWPFLTLPDFHIRAFGTLNVAATTFVGYASLVNSSQRAEWESFALRESTGWIDLGLAHEDKNNNNDQSNNRRTRSLSGQPIPEQIYRFEETSDGLPMATVERYDSNGGPYFPIWQHSPIHEESVNFNLISHAEFQEEVQIAAKEESIVLGLISEPSLANQIIGASDDPFSHLYFPIFNQFEQHDASNNMKRELVAMLILTVDWTRYFQDASLPPSANRILCVVTNGCGQAYTYMVKENKVVFLTEGDAHDIQYETMEESIPVWELLQQDAFLSYEDLRFNSDFCPYSLHIFPSEATEQAYYTKRPAIYTAVVILVFLFTSLTFFLYDYLVERRQQKVLTTATKNHAIVASLFPENVRNRLFGESVHADTPSVSGAGEASRPPTEKMKIKSFVDTDVKGGKKSSAPTRKKSGQQFTSTKPIADLFPNTTVLFADVAGFTAWSSVREPAQVFVLLETLYAAFDKVASKRKVFKVETIGDCYVAVTGVPVAQEHHAIIMMRFAQDCLRQTYEVTRQLAKQLGPDTADLGIRIGCHSGPVTAGVLRGQKSRFQLFGDTVNTASRMESTGKTNTIQISQATADLLMEAGKTHWIEAREDLVNAKGIGEVQTYFIHTRNTSNYEGSTTARSSSDNDSDVSSFGEDYDGVGGMERLETAIRRHSQMIDLHADATSAGAFGEVDDHLQRLIDWNFDLLSRQLKVIMARRMVSPSGPPPNRPASFVYKDITSGGNPRDEYAKSIVLPRFDPKAINSVDPDRIKLDEIVEEQLLDLISSIAHMYCDNPFHNFEHATHVTMSANKILNRVVAADDCEVQKAETKDQVYSHLHDFTYGITSDPLTHFACIFSAMIHDLDHPGVSNTQLVTEKDARAELYVNKSVAEQNSVDLSWDLLMEVAYAELRGCLFESEADMRRFRRLVVNSVMATDIFDPDLKSLRNDRWDAAFFNDGQDSQYFHPAEEDIRDLKATIVIEHIIQASDVAHTMQHWHIYQKWNRRLFEEMYKAYKAGRFPNDPSQGWYKGELWFYDNYIIPLANKLKDCGVFGVASDEFLNYAQRNRQEWESKGQEIVKEMHNRLSNGQSLEE